MFENIKASYINKANYIEDWDKMDKNELAAYYLDSEGNPQLQESYISALICRYWNVLNKYRIQNKNSPVPLEECYNWLITGMMWAMNELKNKWRDPNNKLYGDPCGADKVINRCLFSARAGFFQDANRAKRVLNYQTDSLDARYDDFGDYWDNLIDEPSVEEVPRSLDTCYLLIQSYIKQGKILEAIILDEICFQDCFRDGELNQRKLVSDIKHITEPYIEYLTSNYDIPNLKEELTSILEMSNPRIYTKIKHLLKDLRRENLCF